MCKINLFERPPCQRLGGSLWVIFQKREENKMYLVVGLGNPDRQYADTFHNVGFLVADRLARLLGANFDKGECRAICAHARLCGEKVIVAKPITYMNLSGRKFERAGKKI